MTRVASALRTRSHGQGLVEFALVFPIIMLLIFGAIDLGRAVYAYNTISNAARDGARVAMVNQIVTSPDCSENKPVEDPADPHWSIKQCAIQAAVSLGVQGSDISIAYDPPAGTSVTCSPDVNVGCLVAVTVTYDYSPITPVLSSFSIQLRSTAQMPVERVFP